MAGPGLASAQILFEAVRKVLTDELTVPKTETEVAESLDVSGALARAWLTRLGEAGELEKTGKPVRYRRAGTASRLL